MQFFSMALCSLLAVSLSAQKYIVYSIKGEVKADGVSLQVKSVISDDTQLTFLSQEDEIYVVSPTKGKMIISGRKTRKNNHNEFFAAVKEAILPPEEYRPTSIRKTENELVFLDLFDLKSFFRHEVLLIDTTRYILSVKDFEQDGSSHFILEYPTGESVQTVVLPGHGDTLFMSMNFLSPLSETKREDLVEKMVRLYYYDQVAQRKTLIGSFTAVQGTAVDIASELSLLYELIPKEPTRFLYEEALPFLDYKYGKPNPIQVKKILQDHLSFDF